MPEMTVLDPELNRAMGQDVWIETRKLRKSGLCWACRIGKAIDIVGRRHGFPTYDWQWVARNGGHEPCKEPEPRPDPGSDDW